MKKGELEDAWRVFRTWCSREDVSALPASPHAVRCFLVEQGRRWTKLDRLEATLDGIAGAHRSMNLEDPTRDPVVIAEVERFGALRLAWSGTFDQRISELAAFATAQLERKQPTGAPGGRPEPLRHDSAAWVLAARLLERLLGREPIDEEVDHALRIESSIVTEILPGKKRH